MSCGFGQTGVCVEVGAAAGEFGCATIAILHDYKVRNVLLVGGIHVSLELPKSFFAHFARSFVDIVNDIFVKQIQHGFSVVAVKGFKVGGDEITGAWHTACLPTAQAVRGASDHLLVHWSLMPELPEVETVRALLDRLLTGRKLIEVEALPDSIVYESASHDEVREAIFGKVPSGTGRKGKLFWLTFADAPALMMHLGMSGWVFDINAEREKRLVSHGSAPLEDPEGRPRFLKLMWRNQSSAAAFTDGRRLARIWLGDPATDSRVLRMGPDVLLEPPTLSVLEKQLKNRTAPIKALLLDQKLFCGIGNWVADEVLYASGIAPQRAAGTLSVQELRRLCDAVSYVISLSVRAEADESRYPSDWLFHVRWGGGKGADIHQGEELRRDQVGGRTTAWVPARQK